MRTDLTFEIPPGLIASSISSTGASRTASHASKRSRRRRKATSRLRSLVDCESTVSTSSPTGSPWGSITGIPYIARRRSRTARTRLARGLRQGVGTREVSSPRRWPRSPSTTTRSAISPCSGAAPRATSRPCSTCTASRRARTTGSAFLERTGGLAPDLPGFGRSGKRGDGDFTMPGYDRFVETFLDHAEVERVRLVVHDWGVVGLLWAQRFPERVERLVVINAVPLLPGYRWHRVARLWRMRGVGEVAVGLSTRWAWRRALPPELADESWPHFDQGTQRAILQLYRASPEDALARAGLDLGRIDCPALVVWGDRDPYLPSEFAEAYAGALGGEADVLHLPDAGHWPWLDRPDAVDRIAAFLDA